jgi:hypothetical protein
MNYIIFMVINYMMDIFSTFELCIKDYFYIYIFFLIYIYFHAFIISIIYYNNIYMRKIEKIKLIKNRR